MVVDESCHVFPCPALQSVVQIRGEADDRQIPSVDTALAYGHYFVVFVRHQRLLLPCMRTGNGGMMAHSVVGILRRFGAGSPRSRL